MDRNSIVIERPAHLGRYNDNTGPRLFRIWTRWGTERYLCFHPMSFAALGFWPTFQCAQISAGKARRCTFFNRDYNSSAFTKPGGGAHNWTNAPVNTRAGLLHNAFNPNRPLIWVADRDYAYVAINAFRNAALYTDIAIALSGTGTLLHATVNCSTAASPFWPPGTDSCYQTTLMGKQRFVSVAKDVRAGDTLTFTVPDGASTLFSAVLGITNEYVAPTTADALHLTNQIMLDDDPAIDTEPFNLRLRREVNGDTMALAVTPATAATYWGSEAHAAAANTITGAGGSGYPTVTLTYFTAAAPGGTAWAPALGERTTCRALKILVVGEMRHNSIQRGVYRECHTFDAGGYSVAWEIYFNGTLTTFQLGKSTGNPAPNAYEGGYSAMFTVLDDQRFVLSPNLVAPTALITGGNNQTAFNAGPIMNCYGGTVWKGLVLAFQAMRTEFAAGGQTFVQEYDDHGNKIYHRLDAMSGGLVTPSANDRISGGFRITVCGREELAPMVPQAPAGALVMP